MAEPSTFDDEAVFISICEQTSEVIAQEGDDDDAVAMHMMKRQQMRLSLYQYENREIAHRRYTDRKRQEHAEKLMLDYFADPSIRTYSDANFHDRFRMRRVLFCRILDELLSVDPFFAQRYDARNIPGHTPHQKLVGALRILAYGVPSQATDEYVRMGKATAQQNFSRFCSTMVRHFGPRYLRKPTSDDVRRLFQENERRGFPGMLGSVDCMHWEWKNCPIAWQGQFKGHHKKPTLVLEAVASYDLWIWHAFFGTPGASNDLNVLDRSDLFDDLLCGRAPDTSFTVNGKRYDIGYYLGDGIYPKYSTIVKSFRVANTPQKEKFNEQQQAKRKDIERAFAMLKAKWQIVAGPVKHWDREELEKIMKTCIILQNMIIEDEHRDPNWTGVYSDADRERVRGPRGVGLDLYSARKALMQDKKKHNQLRKDLVAHIWTRHGMGVVNQE